MAHEITGTDRVVLIEGHPLSGMGNWHGLADTWQWGELETPDSGLTHTIVEEVLGVGKWVVHETPLADARLVADDTVFVGQHSLQDAIIECRENGLLVLDGDAVLEAHKGVACGDNEPHYFPTKAYTVVQNEELAELAYIFQEAAQQERNVTLPILSVGTLRDRRLAFVSVGIPDDNALDGLPARGYSMNLGTSHDGTTALVGCLAPYIVVCGNTFRASLLSNAPQEVRIKHTANMRDSLSTARMVLRDMVGAATETDAAIARLLDTVATADHFFHVDLDKVVEAAYGNEKPTDEGRGLTVWENRADAIADEYYSEHVPAGHRGTAWAALMALQGYEQHHRIQRRSNGVKRHPAAVTMQRTLAVGADNGYPLASAYIDHLAEAAA